jgi:hypothetical protein
MAALRVSESRPSWSSKPGPKGRLSSFTVAHVDYPVEMPNKPDSNVRFFTPPAEPPFRLVALEGGGITTPRFGFAAVVIEGERDAQ